jgi:catechol 2,3-dioxygenase-like lactoylglutathione lyase family enzyme
MSEGALEFDHIHLISASPHDTARWYVEMMGAVVDADTVARGATQIFLSLGGRTIVVRGERPGESPVDGLAIEDRGTYSSHNTWGIDHFGFLYHGDLRAFCAELESKGVTFPVPLKDGVGGRLLCYVAAPDGVSIELIQA